METKKIWLAALLLLPVLLALALPRLIDRNADKAVLVQCANPVAGCVVPVGGRQAEVRFLSSPVPLQAFELVAKISDAKSVSADFSMQGMDMGPNRYMLQPVTKDEWRGRAILPVCVSGVSNWVLLLELDDGAKAQMQFAVTR